jgi:transcriptional regulator with XRE-family HTH domain
LTFASIGKKLMEDKYQIFLQKLGKRIAQIRKEKNLTQFELSILAKMDDSSIRRIESGRNNSSIIILVRLAEAMNISLKELLSVEETL